MFFIRIFQEINIIVYFLVLYLVFITNSVYSFKGYHTARFLNRFVGLTLSLTFDLISSDRISNP